MADFKTFNRMAVSMEHFHNHFRQTWTMLYNAACTGNRPAGMSMRQFLAAGVQFCSQLALHHGIEEQHIFPILARKMSEFQTTAQRKKNGTDGVKGWGG